MHLSELSKIVKGRLIGKDIDVNKFYIDGRQSVENGCYFALVGENLNGHDFINQAVNNGAVCAIVSQEQPCNIPVILVDDTTKSLAELAVYHRQLFSLPVVALTGSCGKTTVKEMISSILADDALVTMGNFNNHIGVPLSLLGLDNHHKYAVFELGANHVGEIKLLSSIVKPDISLITNIAPAHLEGFGSIAGVARAKGEIFSSLTKNGLALVNIDDELVKQQAKLNHSGKVLNYSLVDASADIYANNLTIDSLGNYSWDLIYQAKAISIQLTVPGKHNVMNALAAAAVGCALGINLPLIKEGLENFRGVKGRLAIKQGLFGARIIDDSYNANVRSVKAAIDVLSKYNGNNILVLGDLAETGDELNNHYQEIAKYAEQCQLDLLFTCGNSVQVVAQSFSAQAKHFATQNELISALRNILNENVTVLVKGSRSSQMENVVAGLSR